jgi:hypothetical protein
MDFLKYFSYYCQKIIISPCYFGPPVLGDPVLEQRSLFLQKNCKVFIAQKHFHSLFHFSWWLFHKQSVKLEFRKNINWFLFLITLSKYVLPSCNLIFNNKKKFLRDHIFIEYFFNDQTTFYIIYVSLSHYLFFIHWRDILSRL